MLQQASALAVPYSPYPYRLWRRLFGRVHRQQDGELSHGQTLTWLAQEAFGDDCKWMSSLYYTSVR